MEKSDPLRELMLAAVLLTRLPLPTLPATAFAIGHHAVWAYPVVGFGIGLLGGLTGLAALLVGLPVLAAAVLALGSMMLLTGAMHEDGLADLFDGFWGGFTPAKRLEIMRDSQIGTYGVLALVMVSLLRLSAVMILLQHGHWTALPVAAALSRGMMPALMALLPSARNDGLAKSVGCPSPLTAAIAAGIGAFLTLFFSGFSGLVGITAAVAITAIVGLLANAKIGGQTGDVLGATQQLSEAAVLLTGAALLSA